MHREDVASIKKKLSDAHLNIETEAKYLRDLYQN